MMSGSLRRNCQAGQGRTSTLIALYMMKHHGFTAREAMGWLRIVRPGSVIAEQQDYLCAAEPAIRRAGAAHRRRAGMGGARVAAGAPVGEVAALIAAAVTAADARAATLALGARAAEAAPGPPELAAALGRLARHVVPAVAGRGPVRAHAPSIAPASAASADLEERGGG